MPVIAAMYNMDLGRLRKVKGMTAIGPCSISWVNRNLRLIFFGSLRPKRVLRIRTYGVNVHLKTPLNL